MGAGAPPARELFSLGSAQGVGYAQSLESELRTIAEVARATGISLDPVYSGKALHYFLAELRAAPERFGKHIVFVHTGGALGLHAKIPMLAPLLASPRPKPLPPSGEASTEDPGALGSAL